MRRWAPGGATEAQSQCYIGNLLWSGTKSKEERADEAAGPQGGATAAKSQCYIGNLLWSGTKSTRRREPMRLLGPRWRYSSPVIILHTGNLLWCNTKSMRKRDPMRLLGPR
jgi:hypothetical protein